MERSTQAQAQAQGRSPGLPGLPEDPAPQFGDVAHLAEPCTPRDLYCRLLEVEDHVHYLEPAFRFVHAALEARRGDAWLSDRAADAGPEPGEAFIARLVARARAELAPALPRGYASSWPLRIAREFAPLGLIDGIWLQGLVQFHMVENPVGMAALGQLMIHFAGPGVGETYAQRYAALLRSTGIVPASVGRWETELDAPCAAISYEHALLAAGLAQFPSAFTAETLGFNLWMAAIGPCPLLDRLVDDLRRRACMTYFDGYDRGALLAQAERAVLALLAEPHGDATEPRARIARGFAAAHHSYQRWEQAMCGRNVPRTPRDFVLEMIGRKARFAIGHHLDARLGGPGEPGQPGELEAYFAGGRAGHEALLDRLAASRLIRPGAPDRSRFLVKSIAFGGPMFDVFTAAEQVDLREWVAGLGDAHGDDRSTGAAGAPDPVALEGAYTPPQDPDGLRNHAIAHYASLSAPELLYRLLNADRFPPVRVFGKIFVTNALGILAHTLDSDPRLGSATPPRYSERMVAEMVEANHARNVRTRSENVYELEQSPAATTGTPTTQVSEVVAVHNHAGGLPGAPLDGCWLGGFADVHRVHLEEYGWLFRIYASELGDGHMEHNHNYILRRMQIERGAQPEDTMLSLRDRRLYDVVQVTLAEIIMIALSLNTRCFLPEMLGMNLFIEAKGVGGYYLTTMKTAQRMDHPWTALSMQLHNSIDNYAMGHTQWSVDAIQAYMARVQDAAPQAHEAQWHRIWRLWRFNEIRDYGSDAERTALEERLGEVATDSFVPSEL